MWSVPSSTSAFPASTGHVRHRLELFPAKTCAVHPTEQCKQFHWILSKRWNGQFCVYYGWKTSASFEWSSTIFGLGWGSYKPFGWVLKIVRGIDKCSGDVRWSWRGFVWYYIQDFLWYILTYHVHCVLYIHNSSPTSDLKGYFISGIFKVCSINLTFFPWVQAGILQ